MSEVRCPFPVCLSDRTRKFMAKALRSLADDLEAHVPETEADVPLREADRILRDVRAAFLGLQE